MAEYCAADFEQTGREHNAHGLFSFSTYPLTIYHLPFTIHHLPFTIYQLPITTHQLPFTVHHLPFTLFVPIRGYIIFDFFSVFSVAIFQF